MRYGATGIFSLHNDGFKLFALMIMLLLPGLNWGQHCGLEVYVTSSNFYLNDTHYMVISHGNDTVLKTNFHVSKRSEDSLHFKYMAKSLEPGVYEISIWYGNKIGEHPWYHRKVRLINHYMTVVEIETQAQVEYLEIDTTSGKTIVEESEEQEVCLAIMDNSLIEPNSKISRVFVLGHTVYLWKAFSKHAGALIGGGYGWSYYKLAPDSASLFLNNSKIKRQSYHYLYLNIDFKLRLSASNQKEAAKNKFYTDLGLRYNLPLIFRQNSVYKNQKQTTEWGLHQFTDFRCFVNIGVKRIFLFAEYRPLDFVLGRFSEIARYHAGIKLALPLEKTKDAD